MAVPEIPEEAQQAQSVAEAVLGDSIIGIYLFGSAIVGGLKRDSDVDILVAVTDPPTFAQRKFLVDRLMRISGVIGNQKGVRPIELTVVTGSDVVPWRFPPRAEFVYGEWLREEFESGVVPEPAHDPDLAIILKKVLDNSLSLNGSDASEVFDPVPPADIQKAIRDALPDLLTEVAGDERNVVLTLSRMWLTATTGEIVPKEVATAWAEDRVSPEYARLLNYAREGYLGRVEDRWEDKHEDVKALLSYMKNNISESLGDL